MIDNTNQFKDQTAPWLSTPQPSSQPQQQTSQQNLALDPDLIGQLRQQIQNGLDPKDAYGQYQQSIGYTPGASMPTAWDQSLKNALYSNLGTVQAGGQFGQVNNVGDFQRQTTALQQSITGGGGTNTNTLALRGPETANPDIIKSRQQFDNPLPNQPNILSVTTQPNGQPTMPGGPNPGVLSSQMKAIQGQLGNPGTLIKQ